MGQEISVINKPTLWAVNQVTGVLLILPTATVFSQVTINLPSCPVDNILIHRINCQAEFQDSSTGINYDVSEKVRFLLPTNRYTNLDITNFGISSLLKNDINYGGSLGIRANLNAIQSINPIAILYGGDIVVSTGITPAAGDNVSFNFSINYEPLTE